MKTYTINFSDGTSQIINLDNVTNVSLTEHTTETLYKEWHVTFYFAASKSWGEFSQRTDISEGFQLIEGDGSMYGAYSTVQMVYSLKESAVAAYEDVKRAMNDLSPFEKGLLDRLDKLAAK